MLLSVIVPPHCLLNLSRKIFFSPAISGAAHRQMAISALPLYTDSFDFAGDSIVHTGVFNAYQGARLMPSFQLKSLGQNSNLIWPARCYTLTDNEAMHLQSSLAMG